MHEFGYPADGARLVAEKLARCQPWIREAFCAWWEAGTLPNLTVEGYTAQTLIEKHRMQPIAAFLTLDWLAREPALATASLKKGRELVTFCLPRE
jgi:hypothetical protein